MRELFPDVGEELSLLLDGAVENSGLLASDYMTVRDLLELSGYAHEEPLHVLLLILLTALDEGSLCVEVSEERLSHRLASLASAASVGSWPSRIADALRRNAYPELIAEADRPDKPIVRRRVGDRTFFYFQRQHAHDARTGPAARRRFEQPQRNP